MNDHFSELVSKVLAGEASSDEKQQLKMLLVENKEQTLLYNQLKEYWDADVKIIHKNTESLEAKVLSQINFEPEIRKSKYKKLYLRISSVAAVVFFAMTCGLAYLYTSGPKEFYTYSAQSVPVEYLLEDGTRVTLNKNSSLTFASDFGNKRRNVKLIGEAFFKVAKDRFRPFEVEALGTKTEVLGTSFNVQANAEKKEVTTTLVEGSVKFLAEECAVMLKPGDEIVYSQRTKKYALSKTDVQYNTAWVAGRYIYNNMSFAGLIEKLERIYHIKIDINDKAIAERIVSASFLTEEPIENILDALKTELKYSYNIDSNIITIKCLTYKK
jgi:transmembrane sensor